MGSIRLINVLLEINGVSGVTNNSGFVLDPSCVFFHSVVTISTNSSNVEFWEIYKLFFFIQIAIKLLWMNLNSKWYYKIMRHFLKCYKLLFIQQI